MKRILDINPNTSASVTDMVLASCRLAFPEVAWEGATGRLGAACIASEAAYALAAHAALDAYAECYAGHDAVLVACFGDPGLLALREVAAVPVVGLAQASLQAAARLGPFAVVTGGAAWGPMLARFARMHQLDAGLVAIHAVELAGAQIAAGPERAMDALFAACELAVQAGANSIVLGGAALTGLAAALQPRLSVPVLDSVVLGAQAVVEQAGEPAAVAHTVSKSPVMGLGTALSSLLG